VAYELGYIIGKTAKKIFFIVTLSEYL